MFYPIQRVGPQKILARYYSMSTLPVTSFGQISKGLASDEEAIDLVVADKGTLGKIAKHSNKKSLYPKNKAFSKVTSFSQVLEKSPVFQEICPDEKSAEKFILKSVEFLVDRDGGRNFSLHSTDVERVLKEAAESYPIKKIDPATLERMTVNKPTFNLARVVNEVPTLQKLVDLGVDIANWEKIGKMHIALSLDMDLNVAPKILALVDLGIDSDELGPIFSRTPDLFSVDNEDLQVRVNYLQSKNFTKTMIADVVRLSYGRWLTFPVVDIDNRLGYFQKTFRLTGQQVRQLASTDPNLILWKGTPYQVNLNHQVVMDSLGFTKEEAKNILIKCPRVFKEKYEDRLSQNFIFLQEEVGLTHEQIQRFPILLIGSKSKMVERHEFLKKLSRNQFDPKEPNYVCPLDLMEGTDSEFCTKAAKVDVTLFNDFLMTL